VCAPFCFLEMFRSRSQEVPHVGPSRMLATHAAHSGFRPGGRAGESRPAGVVNGTRCAHCSAGGSPLKRFSVPGFPVALIVVTLVFALMTGCTPAADSPSGAGSTVPDTASTPPESGTVVEVPADRTDDDPPREANIYIDAVEIGNPLVISGRARTFENNVVLRARDAAGKTIAEGFTTSNGEMGTHNPFRGSLWLTRHPGQRIVVQALEYSAKDGSETNVATLERPFGIDAIEARLFFPDESCTNTRPFVRRLPKTVSMARLLVEALVAGPTQEEVAGGAATPFPSGSRVQSVNLRDGVLTVDFNERLQNVGGACRAQMIRASVTRTLSELPTVKSVVITAAGSEKLALQP
jgi:hypothetical protein